MADRESALPKVRAIDVAEALWLARHVPAEARSHATTDVPIGTVTPSDRQLDLQAQLGSSEHDLQPSSPTSHAGRTPLPEQLGPPAHYVVTQRAVPGSSIPRSHASSPVLSRALKPLRVTVDSPFSAVLDEESTAEGAAAFQGVWLPVIRPAPERAFDVILLVDTHSTMAPWRHTVNEVRQSLCMLGAFRNIREVPLVTTQNPSEDLVRLVERTNSRQLVLLVTDGLADAWGDGRLSAALHALATSQLLSILHVMSDSAWSLGHIQGHRTRVRHNGGVPRCNADWRTDNEPRLNGQEPATGITVPVITLEERFLTTWATFIAGKVLATNLPMLTLSLPCAPGSFKPQLGKQQITGIPAPALPPVAVGPSDSEHPALPASPDEDTTAAEDLVALEARLTAHLSPDELEVACILAAVPLTEANMQAALTAVAPALEPLLPSVLSSLLAINALVPVNASHRSEDNTGTETVDFVPGLRARLLAHAQTSETARAMSAAHSDLDHDDAWTIFDAAALIDPTTHHPIVTADNLRRAELSATVFTALSGKHRPLGKELTRATQALHGSSDAERSTEHQRSAAALPTQRRRHPLKTRRNRWSPVPSRDRHFTGRQAQLTQLRAMLRPGTFSEVAVLGMAGVGKSHLVTEYIYRYSDDYDLIWWIPPQQSRDRNLSDAYRVLANRLANEGVVLSDDDPVTAVLEALRSGVAADRWLLVVDDAPSAATIRPLLPVAGPGHVIVTSRDPRWELEQEALRLTVFNRSESTALLRARNPRLTAEEADELANNLGNLPQAVEDASRMLAETGMSVDDYRRSALTSLLASAPRIGGPHHSATTRTWAVALDRLRDDDAAAYALLQVCAWFGDAPVNHALLPGVAELPKRLGIPGLVQLHADLLGSYLAIRELNRAALVHVNERDGTLTSHRLVREAVRAQMDDETRQATRRAAHLLLAARIPGEGTTDQEFLRSAPHFFASGIAESQEPAARRAVVAMVQCLARHGDNATARSLGEAATAAWAGDSRAPGWTRRREPLWEVRRELRRLTRTSTSPRQQRPGDDE